MSNPKLMSLPPELSKMKLLCLKWPIGLLTLMSKKSIRMTLITKIKMMKPKLLFSNEDLFMLLKCR